MNLFDYADTYPRTPGFKSRDTSKAAADAMRPSQPRLRQLVLDTLAVAGPLTADEVADHLRIDRLSIRPRLSELAALGKVQDTGERRKNKSGKSAVVWSLIVTKLAA